MTPEAFAKAFSDEKRQLLNDYFASENETAVAVEIEKMDLDAGQKEQLKKVIEMVLDDTFYTVLLGLDGSAAIGGIQQAYTLFDETGTRIGNSGEIEAAAYEQFHQSNP